MNTSTTNATSNTNLTFVVSGMVTTQRSKTSELSGYNHIGGFATKTKHHHLVSSTKRVVKTVTSERKMLEAIQSGEFEIKSNGKTICSNWSLLGMEFYQIANLQDKLVELPLVIVAALISKANFYAS